MSQLLCSNVASYSTFVRDTKRKARGDNLPPTYMRDGVECEDTGIKYLIMFKTGHYDCVGERDIHHDLSDTDRATVYDKSKPYQVAILARGEFALLAVLFEIKKLILKTI